MFIFLEAPMKYFCLSLVAFFFLITSAFQANAEKAVLTAAQIKKQFAEKTMTVTNARPDSKKGGKDQPFRVFLSEMGVTRVEGSDDQSQNRAWYIAEDGRLCFSRPFSRRHRGKTCGQIVRDDQDQYWMYQTKDIRIKSGSLVGMSKKDLLIMFSDFTPGNDLE